MKKSISLMPNWENTEIWFNLTIGMITGHNKHQKKKINFATNCTIQSQGFTRMKELAEKEIEFYKSIKEICDYELLILRKKNGEE